LLENHDYKEVVGSANAPYINSELIAKYGLATNYLDSGTHPSLPNYLYLISGATQYFGVVDLDPTQSPFPVAADNLGNQMNGAHVKWRSYQESMGTACSLSEVGTLYAPKHDPFLYFTDLQSPASTCAQQNVDYTSFAADLAANAYTYYWITPNLTNDGHNPSGDPVTGLKQTDMWLSTEVPKILASAAYQDGGVLFVTWDEAEGRNGDSDDQIPMIVVTSHIKSPGYQSNVAYTHASYLATMEDLFGVPRLGAAVGAPTLDEFWQ
jgi:phospholipase C